MWLVKAGDRETKRRNSDEWNPCIKRKWKKNKIYNKNHAHIEIRFDEHSVFSSFRYIFFSSLFFWYCVWANLSFCSSGVVISVIILLCWDTFTEIERLLNKKRHFHLVYLSYYVLHNFRFTIYDVWQFQLSIQSIQWTHFGCILYIFEAVHV